MDIRKVKKLIEVLEESGISELEISEGEESVRISRHPRMAMQAPTLRELAGVAGIDAEGLAQTVERFKSRFADTQHEVRIRV